VQRLDAQQRIRPSGKRVLGTRNAEAYLRKPFDAEDLVGTIERFAA
jgi:uncharacterized protein YeeX (DUF496 family)